ncbi:MAG TPA: hypothetical protein VE820_04685 [Sphingomicrobium sp.]|nr:hypothetical protein [Sphingomicrobium sp.]
MRGFLLAAGMAALALFPCPAQAARGPAHAKSPSKAPSPPTASGDAWQVADWVIASHDNNGMPFLVVDKVEAEVLAFDSTTKLVGTAPVLVGITRGDHSDPEVGDRELSDIPVSDRTTPAGRFVATFGHAAGGRDVLWVDYPTAISLHAVITTNKKQRRLERLNSPTPADNRITFGCINVPTAFYAKVVKPLFKGRSGIVYILPETKALNEVFLAMPPPPAGPAAGARQHH